MSTFNVFVNNQIQAVTVPDGDLVLQDDLFVSTSKTKDVIGTLSPVSLPSDYSPIISITPTIQLGVTDQETSIPFTGTITTASDPTNGECDCGITCGEELSYVVIKAE